VACCKGSKAFMHIIEGLGRTCAIPVRSSSWAAGMRSKLPACMRYALWGVLCIFTAAHCWQLAFFFRAEWLRLLCNSCMPCIALVLPFSLGLRPPRSVHDALLVRLLSISRGRAADCSTTGIYDSCATHSMCYVFHACIYIVGRQGRALQQPDYIDSRGDLAWCAVAPLCV
jgi:hypothetical protein